MVELILIEIMAVPAERSRGKHRPRVVKRKMSSFPTIGLRPIPRRDVSKASMMGRWTSIHACSPSGNKRDVSGCCGTQVVQVAQRRHRVPKDPMLVLVPKHALVRHLVAGLMLPSAVGTGGRCIMPSEEVGAPI